MPKEAEPTATDEIALFVLAAIIGRTANQNERSRRLPEAMERHVADAYEYARLMMNQRVPPTPR
jgi:hypothetical protein